jgi:hypothetical protein
MMVVTFWEMLWTKDNMELMELFWRQNVRNRTSSFMMVEYYSYFLTILNE